MCGGVCMNEREIDRGRVRERERETKKESFDLATVSGEPLLRASKQALAAACWWGLLLLSPQA